MPGGFTAALQECMEQAATHGRGQPKYRGVTLHK